MLRRGRGLRSDNTRLQQPLEGSPQPSPRPRAAQSCPQQFVTDDGQYCGTSIAKTLRENADFWVLGVIGDQGAGKSTLLNDVLGLSKESGFRVGQGSAAAQHCTSGIDIQVSADRLIGLDTQPAGSLSAWLRVAKVKVDVPPGITPTMDKLSAAAQQLKQDLQRTVFLLNVCNLVVVLCDGPGDTAMWELLEAAEVLAHGIPDLSLPQQASAADQTSPPQEHLASVVIVHSKVPGDSLERWRQQLQRAADAFFADSPLLQQQHPGSHDTAEGQNGTSVEGAKLFVLPDARSEDDTQAAVPQEHLQDLVHSLLAAPKARFAKPLSEQAWLYGCERVWHQITASEDIHEYCAQWS